MNIITKSVNVFAGLVLVVSMSACSGTETETENLPTSVTTVTETVEPEPASTVTVTEFLPAEAEITEEYLNEEGIEERLAEGESADTSRLYDTSEVLEHVGLVEDEYGMMYEVTTPDGVVCSSFDILISPSEVDIFLGEADATDPTGSVGIVNSSEEAATCQKFFTEALADFEAN